VIAPVCQRTGTRRSRRYGSGDAPNSSEAFVPSMRRVILRALCRCALFRRDRQTKEEL